VQQGTKVALLLLGGWLPGQGTHPKNKTFIERFHFPCHWHPQTQNILKHQGPQRAKNAQTGFGGGVVFVKGHEETEGFSRGV